MASRKHEDWRNIFRSNSTFGVEKNMKIKSTYKIKVHRYSNLNFLTLLQYSDDRKIDRMDHGLRKVHMKPAWLMKAYKPIAIKIYKAI